MSADFWAGYISGAVGILIGNPLDLIKVRLQAQIPSQPLAAEPTLSRQILPSSSPLRLSSIPATSLSLTQCFQTTKSSLVTGTTAPVLGYGALNALLFVTYNRTEDALNHALAPASSNTVLSSTNGGSTTGSNLWTTWLAGAAGGLATWAISTPTELIKCRAQLASTPNPISFSSSSSSSSSSYRIARGILRAEGIRGFYHGGVVTALRDSIGYGFYFWAYEVGSRMITSLLTRQESSIHLDGIDSNNNGLSATAFSTQETIKVLLCGGIAGVVTWASVFPLDVIKTRVQGQAYSTAALDRVVTPLLGTSTTKRKGAVQIAREAYREGGTRVFFRGLMVCSVRAFVVNAVQWAAYEWIMLELGQRNHDRRKESHS